MRGTPLQLAAFQQLAVNVPQFDLPMAGAVALHGHETEVLDVSGMGGYYRTGCGAGAGWQHLGQTCRIQRAAGIARYKAAGMVAGKANLLPDVGVSGQPGLHLLGHQLGVAGGKYRYQGRAAG